MFAVMLSTEKPLLGCKENLLRDVPVHLRPAQSSAEVIAMAERLFIVALVEEGRRRRKSEEEVKKTVPSPFASPFASQHGKGVALAFNEGTGASGSLFPSPQITPPSLFNGPGRFSNCPLYVEACYPVGHKRLKPNRSFPLNNHVVGLSFNNAGPGILDPYPPAPFIWACTQQHQKSNKVRRFFPLPPHFQCSSP